MVNVWNESANATLLKAIELKSEAQAELVTRIALSNIGKLIGKVL